jgi:hypothetical protein
MEMKNPHVIWASVAVVFILVVPASLLVAFGKDVSIILALAGLVAVPVLGAFGVAVYHKLDQVKENSNGNLGRLMDMQQRTQDQLTAMALAMTPQPPQPAPVEEKEKEMW